MPGPAFPLEWSAASEGPTEKSLNKYFDGEDFGSRGWEDRGTMADAHTEIFSSCSHYFKDIFRIDCTDILIDLYLKCAPQPEIFFTLH